MKKIAIIFTCFNRANITKRCIDSIKNQKYRFREKLDIELFVCDDGSTDNTYCLLKNSDLSIKVVRSKGGLFWNKSMYIAMTEAIKTNHDFYLMINDDVNFYSDAIETMLESYYDANESCGITGATRSTSTNKTTYGGKELCKKNFITPNGMLQLCDLANWNCFLIDEKIIKDVGLIDPYYDHSYGDYDYSLMMKRKGYHIYVAKKNIGECDRNNLNGTFKDRSLPKRKRLNLFFSPKGMSFRSGIRYALKNIKYLKTRHLVSFLGAYCRNLILIYIS